MMEGGKGAEKNTFYSHRPHPWVYIGTNNLIGFPNKNNAGVTFDGLNRNFF